MQRAGEETVIDQERKPSISRHYIRNGINNRWIKLSRKCFLGSANLVVALIICIPVDVFIARQIYV